ncbi:BZ3500_MvSof-1268-A1-R1_Chr9g10455 [Microbotryum saponariae]|uniref:BZ3500_MvSof-1268-A1-R1_Chr9g10455 protein n=1 Tax=Microbotryum saponariae TaxID=289078 RepID=A0A2X0L5K4_9BASI|nr:BZ3501_MvSof-1269-A2-R1_Chr9g10205 [Microbotryum saponariae]SDA00120.1 BZ3500_MvSof-1268-A1-R1_Chr9g10455 [Microbotryum saponariae]
MVHAALKKGNSAVITGAAYGGIGYSIATLCLQRYGMRVLLADVSTSALERASQGLIKAGIPEESFIIHPCDVSDFGEVLKLAEVAYASFAKVNFLVLNAGVQMSTKDYSDDPKMSMEAWNKTLNVNLFGVLHGTQAFVDRMVKQDSPAAVVVTASKQGITQPPGNPAYNVSKSAVKSLTEALSHSLLSTQCTAHLLVPGYTWTKLTTNDKILDEGAQKPKAAWTADQVAEQLFDRIENEFYIICPDSTSSNFRKPSMCSLRSELDVEICWVGADDVTWELDQARKRWNFDDILEKRPALSRWHPECKDAFTKHIEQSTAGKR